MCGEVLLIGSFGTLSGLAVRPRGLQSLGDQLGTLTEDQLQ